MRQLAVPVAAMAIIILAAFLPFASYADDGGESASFIQGYVSSDIKGENTFLKNAVITAVGIDGTIYRASTDSKGYFSLPCPEGQYSVAVECNGFEHVDFGNVTAGVLKPPLYVKLDMKDSKAIWGLDTPHALQALGMAVLLSIIGVGAAVFIICRKKRSDAAAGGSDQEEYTPDENQDGIGYGDENGDDYVKDEISDS
jgi:hypothetical protein